MYSLTQSGVSTLAKEYNGYHSPNAKLFSQIENFGIQLREL